MLPDRNHKTIKPKKKYDGGRDDNGQRATAIMQRLYKAAATNEKDENQNQTQDQKGKHDIQTHNIIIVIIHHHRLRAPEYRLRVPRVPSTRTPSTVYAYQSTTYEHPSTAYAYSSTAYEYPSTTYAYPRTAYEHRTTYECPSTAYEYPEHRLRIPRVPPTSTPSIAYEYPSTT